MRRILALIFILGLSGCATLTNMSDSVGDLFKDSDNSEPPAELTEYESEVKLDILWDKSDGDGTDGLALNLVPAVAEGRVIIADHDGLIQARSLLDGELFWEVETDLFPKEALEVYSAWNLEQDISSEDKKKYFLKTQDIM